jgi:D-glycero-D-manno-heptose 1,7-bisphosphate phosphatase
VSRPAVFLDRDGTIIRDHHFIGKPELVELVPGAAAAVRRLNELGWPVVIVTNQSGIARGLFTRADYELVRERTEALLAEAGAHVDATYVCPHHPLYTGPCECRKPGTLLFRQAAHDLDLDLVSSWYIGDKGRDVIPARTLTGGVHRRGILVPNSETPEEEIAAARKEESVAKSLDEAVDRIIESAR